MDGWRIARHSLLSEEPPPAVLQIKERLSCLEEYFLALVLALTLALAKIPLFRQWTFSLEVYKV